VGGPGDDPPDLVHAFVELLTAAATTGRCPRGDELDAPRAAAMRAAEKGVPLRRLIEACLAAAEHVFDRVPAATASQARTAGRSVLAAANRAMGAVVEGYEKAQQLAISRDEAGRREFIDDLLRGHRDPALLAERAERFGVLLASSHVVVVASTERGFTDGTPVVGRIDGELVARFGSHNVLVAARESLLVCILPASLRGAPGEFTRQVRAALGSEGFGRIGIGRPHSGPGGVVRSFDEARNALRLADQLGLQMPVVQAADLMVFPVLTRDPAALSDLVRTVLAPLEQNRGGVKPLLDTLATLFDCQGNSTAAARRRGISVRAVAYRLERVRRLSGYAPDEPTQRFTLEAAVIGARLLGWPDHPLPPP
jgi:sugar diacid utilization regulator